MMYDYKPGEKPILGSKYLPENFELRESDGTYSSYMRPPGSHEALIQTAMLQDVPSNFGNFYEWYSTSWLPRLVYSFLCMCITFLFVLLLFYKTV